jgi:Protein of unknown function (DUF2889)
MNPSPDRVTGPDRTAVPLVDPSRYGSGAYRRRFRLVARSPELVVGEMEDDFHHFGVRLHHDGHRVTAAEGVTFRSPWVTCADGARLIARIVGMALSPNATAVGLVTPAREQCTHTFDLAGLCVAHAWRSARGDGDPIRQYDCDIPDRDPSGRHTCRLLRDGVPTIEWHLEGYTITGPEPFVGVSLAKGFLGFCNEQLDVDTAEAAVALRRAVYISGGRMQQLDTCASAGEVTGATVGTCHTYTPGIVEVALRRRGTQLDFTDHADLLLAGGATGEVV